ncbi:MAG TPA: hypothetical protein VFW68_06010 [Rhodocyclaceae bacterium]|nr:hypothetical protein [Rhodocyclaceae bacterium]
MSNVPVIRPRSQLRPQRQPDSPTLIEALQALGKGDWSKRLATDGREVDFVTAQAYNSVADLLETLMTELARVREQVGQQGLHGERVRIAAARGGWADGVGAINGLLDDLLGALSQRMDLDLRVDQLLTQSQTLMKELRAQQDSLVKLSQRVLTMPLAPPAATSIRVPSPPRATKDAPLVARNGAVQSNASKALVVVNDEITRFRIAATLSQRGFQPLVAETGKDGLELLLANTDAALVLIDVDVPQVGGADTIHIIRGLKEFQELPIIALGQERGAASDQLPKPINLEQLAALLQAWAQ